MSLVARRADDGNGASRHVGSGSGSGLPCPESQHVSRALVLDEPRRLRLLETRAARWGDRAAKVPGYRARVYAQRRHRSLTRPIGPRVAACGSVAKRARCGCGTRWVAMTCRQHLLCGPCLAARSRRLGRRIQEGLLAAQAQYRAALCTRGAQRWRVVLLTLTVRHTGDIEADRAALMAGWRGLYKAMHRRAWGRFPYVGVIEVTPGRDGLGHVHAHVAAVWPWRDWSMVAKLWRQSCPQSTRINIQQARSTSGAAKYLGKYLSKGTQDANFTPELRASVVAGLYNTRQVFTSVRFWVAWVPCCQKCQAPVRLLVVIVKDAYNRGLPPDDTPEWVVECGGLDREHWGAIRGGDPSPWRVLRTDECASVSRAGFPRTATATR